MDGLEPESPQPVYHPQYAHDASNSQLLPSEERRHSPRTDLLSVASHGSRGSGSTRPSSRDNLGHTEGSTSRRKGGDGRRRARERAHAARTRDELVILLIHAESDIKRLHKALNTAQQSVRDETNRSLEAERIAKDLGVRLRQALDEKTQLQHDYQASQEEVRLCRLRLEHSKTEVERAQRAVSSLTQQRNDAEKSAARARGIARKLGQRRMVDAAREEGRRLGFEAGFKRAQQELGLHGRVTTSNPEYPFTQAQEPAHAHQAAPQGDAEQDLDEDDDDSYSFSEDDLDLPTTPPHEPYQPFIPPSASETPQSATPQKPKEPPQSYPVQPPRQRMPEPAAQPQSFAVPIQPSQSSRRRGRDYRPPPSPSVDMYSVDIPAASVVERANNINPPPRQPTYIVPPDNFIPVGSGDGKIALPPPHEFTPHQAQSAPLPPGSDPPLSAPPAAQQGTEKHRSSWYRHSQGGQGQLPPASASSQNWYPPPPPHGQPKRRGSLLGSIGRSVGAALGFKRHPPQQPVVKNRINLDSPGSEEQAQPPQAADVPPQVESVTGAPKEVAHKRSRSTGDDLEARLASLRNGPAQTPYGVATSARSHRSATGSQDLKYSTPEAVDQWRAKTANSLNVKPLPHRSGRRGAQAPLSPGSRSSGRHLYVANQSETDLADMNSGAIGIKVEPPSSSSQQTPNAKSGSPYHPTTHGPSTNYIPPPGVVMSAGSAASGRKPPRSRAASVTGTPLHPALQAQLPSRPGSAMSSHSRSRSVSGGPTGTEVPSVRRISSNASLRSAQSGYSGTIANDGNYRKFDPSQYTAVELYQPDTPVEADSPTRLNTLRNAQRMYANIQQTPQIGTPAGPSRPRSLRSAHGVGPGSDATSMYAAE